MGGGGGDRGVGGDGGVGTRAGDSPEDGSDSDSGSAVGSIGEASAWALVRPPAPPGSTNPVTAVGRPLMSTRFLAASGSTLERQMYGLDARQIV